MSEPRYPQSITGNQNKHFHLLPLYYGRPMIWHDTGYDYNQYRQKSQQWFMYGFVCYYHKDMIGVTWWNALKLQTRPVFRMYNEHDFYHKIPIKYAYGVGDMVQCVTTGEPHVISRIQWGVNLHVSVDDMPIEAQLSYDLYIPLDDNRQNEYHPMDINDFEGVFTI
jgi:hypothetical protein